MTEQRFDIVFSTKEIMREAAGPTTASQTKLKRIARYLKRRQRCVLNFPWVAKLEDVIHVTVDADWAGDPKTRCSRSGGVLAIGPCFTVRHWSMTRATVSLSSAESEAKAITKGCIEALYMKHLLELQSSRWAGTNCSHLKTSDVVSAWYLFFPRRQSSDHLSFTA